MLRDGRETRMREKKKSKYGFLLVVLLLAVVLGSLWGIAQKDSARRQNAPTAMKNSILRCAAQCYAVEGNYPGSLSYLEEHYGLRINTADYYVVYNVFASNVPPEVRIVSKDAH